MAKGGKRPDVLFIAIEDVSPHRFGCWGNKICKTPNIDRLAGQGMRFDQAHSMTAICNPSRTSLLTCLRPDTTKIYGNGIDLKKAAPNSQSMPEQFKKNGYETIRIGKIFHKAYDHKSSWTRAIAEGQGLPRPKNKMRRAKGPDVDVEEGQARMAQLKRDGKKAEIAALRKKWGNPYGSPFTWGGTGRDDLEELDGMLATQAVRVLEGKRDKPLFLALGFHAPHLSWRAPDKYFDMYPPEKMVLPVRDPKAGKSRDHRMLTEETWREAIAAHYACLTFIDAQVGRVLEALERSGRADNTIIALWSDHGYMLGEHYKWRKAKMYDQSTGVALIMKAPGVTSAGSVCKRPVESIDIFPTLFELAGVPMPQDIEAVSMKRLLEDPARPWKRGAVTAYRTKRTIRTERYRYSEELKRKHKKTVKSLFDHQTDPHALKNLAGDPAHAATVSELSKLLNGPWQDLLPPDVR